MSTPRIKKVLSFRNPWRNEMECAWLTRQSAQGWHLTKARLFYHFEKGTPLDLVYAIDVPAVKVSGDSEDYIQLCQDAGWAYVCRNGLLFYFRAEALSVRPATIFADTQAQIIKYSRTLKMLLLSSLPQLSTLLVTFYPVFWHENRPQWFIQTMFAVFSLSAVLAGVWLYYVIGLATKIRRLKRQEHAQ